MIQIILIIALVSFILSNNFIVSFDIGEYQYSFSSNLFFAFIGTILIILYFVQYIFFKTRFSLQRYLFLNKYKRLQKGYNYFVDAMIAIANKDRVVSDYIRLQQNRLHNISQVSYKLLNLFRKEIV